MTQTSRRDRLTLVSLNKADTHAGLWIDKFLRSQEDDKRADSDKQDTNPRNRLVLDAASVVVPDAYARFFLRWHNALKQHEAASPAHPRTSVAFAQVDNRLAVGLGAEAAIETSVALHRTYGVPVIPGSALKGLAAAFVRQRLGESDWGPQTQAYCTLFGDTNQAGYVTFFDALFVPGSGRGPNGLPLMPDVMTVHHPDYYQGDKPPADWDSPTPVPFPTATGVFLLALAGPDAWRSFALDLLRDALRELGVGAKTSSGYGRMTVLDGEGEARLQTHLANMQAYFVNSLDEPMSVPTALPFAETVSQQAMPSLPNAASVRAQPADLSRLPRAEDAKLGETNPIVAVPLTEPTSVSKQVITEGEIGGVNDQQGQASVRVAGSILKNADNSRPRFVAALRGKLATGTRVRVRQLADGTWEIFKIIT